MTPRHRDGWRVLPSGISTLRWCLDDWAAYLDGQPQSDTHTVSDLGLCRGPDGFRSTGAIATEAG